MAQPLGGDGRNQPASSSGEEHFGMTSQDQSGEHVDHHGHKGSSIFGKLKDKTKRAGSKIKRKVGKSRTNGDGSTTSVDDDQGEEEADATSSTSSGNAGSSSPTSPGIKITPYFGPASVPRVFGTYPTPKPRRFEDADTGGGTDSAYNMSTLNLSDAQNSASETKSLAHEPYATEKSSENSSKSGRRGYDAPALTRDADMGYNEFKDQSKKVVSSEPHIATDTAFETKNPAQSVVKDMSYADSDATTGKEQESGAALGSQDASAGSSEMNLESEEPSVMDKAKDSISNGLAEGNAASGINATGETLYTDPRSTSAPVSKMRDAAQSEADNLNNVNDGSETHTDKAAIATKDTPADTWGMNQPSQGLSEVDKTKDTGGSVVDTTRDPISSEIDMSKSSTNNVDTIPMEETADNTLAPTDTSKDSANQVNVIGADVPTPKEEDEALSERITEALGWLVPSSTIPASGHGEASPGVLGKITGFLGPKTEGDQSQSDIVPHSNAATTASNH